MARDYHDNRYTRAKLRLAGFWTCTIVNIFFLSPIAINSGEYGLPSMDDYPVSVIFPWIVNGLLLLGPSVIISSEFAVGYMVSLGMLALASLLYVPSCLVACIITADGFGGAVSFLECFLLMYVLAWLGLAGWFSQRYYWQNCMRR